MTFKYLFLFLAVCSNTYALDAEVFAVDLQSHKMMIYVQQNEISTLKNIHKQLTKSKDILFLTNGPIFDKGFVPMGLLISDGALLSPLNTKSGDGNFYLSNGIFELKENVPTIFPLIHYKTQTNSPEFAFQAGPILISNNKINPKLKSDSKSKYTRSGLGITKDKQLTFLITKEKINLYDFAHYFKHNLNCIDAIYLDGGISGYLSKNSSLNLHRKYASIITVLTKDGQN